ncbi:hypothetical protein ACFPLB_10620 [Aquamicrobium segne]|uniref:4Fe-4S ferredoxin-type domain-containing protein n=1 Tax=Aquamicrobium segne TaxID=469547 RepID=A0ABW0GXN0_9HYPH
MADVSRGTSQWLQQIADDLAALGLLLRGGFNFGPDEDSPPATGSERAQAVLLVGQAGAAPWPHFRCWQKRTQVSINPLDTWSREVIGEIALRIGARSVSPNDRPFLPFQQWAMRAEGIKPSPLGILMHPQYGLWHAYRGALLLDHEVSIQVPEDVNHLCDTCVGKPCLKACPVNAYSLQGFDYLACLEHVRGPEGQPCRTQGCLDRNACPHGAEYRYPEDVQAYHMAAFASLPSAL